MWLLKVSEFNLMEYTVYSHMCMWLAACPGCLPAFWDRLRRPWSGWMDGWTHAHEQVCNIVENHFPLWHISFISSLVTAFVNFRYIKRVDDSKINQLNYCKSKIIGKNGKNVAALFQNTSSQIMLCMCLPDIASCTLIKLTLGAALSFIQQKYS